MTETKLNKLISFFNIVLPDYTLFNASNLIKKEGFQLKYDKGH